MTTTLKTLALRTGALLAGCVAPGTAAFAAGTTAIEAGFADVGTDLQTLLTGAGGFIIVIISVAIAAVMLAVGRGWGQAVVAFGVAIFLGYGVTALTGIAGVSASAQMLSSAEIVAAQAN